MGEVYRATDTRLSRAIAIKVLPANLSKHPQVRERFAREARSISQLGHPNICAVHDVGSHDGIDFLVMELLDGESLADRLSRGALPLADVLRYGAQIAEALAFAHRAGVVHRDVKPGNIVLTKSGAKLLDFGLAKVAAGATFAPDAPTEQQGRPLTAEGSILGTLQYMAPEQLAGEEADARTDVFALGLVLYEMTTGRRAFDGQSRTSLVAAIVGREPEPISRVVPLTPKTLEQIIATCLAKDPEHRWQSAYDVALQLRSLGETRVDADERPPAGRAGTLMRWVPAALAVLALLSALVVVVTLRRAPATATPIRGSIALPAETLLFMEGPHAGAVTISPDSRFMTFAAAVGTDPPRIWVRDMRTGDARMLPGTEFAEYPFWSPDSRQLGFFADGKLKTIPADGGPTVEVCRVKEPRGATWGPDGVIVFSNHWRGALFKVLAAGGTPAPLTQLDARRNETTHRWPKFLPDGKHFLYFAGSHTSPDASGDNALYVGSVDGGTPRLLIRTRSNAEYAAGQLLYLRGDELVAQKFDAGSLALEGDAVRIASGILYDRGFFHGAFAASDRFLVYQQGASSKSRLTWMTRDGRVEGEPSEPDVYFSVAIAPAVAGNVAAVSIADPADIWLIDFDRKIKTRFTSDPWEDNSPAWSPDGKSLLYWNNRREQNDAYVQPLAGRAATPLSTDPSIHEIALNWSRAGILVAKSKLESPSYDLWLHQVGNAAAARPLIASGFDEWDGRISPDGSMIAWVSDESGRDEIYLATVANPLEKLQVSNGGAAAPRWRGDSRELFYIAADSSIVSVPLLGTNPVRAAAATPLFTVPIMWALEPFYDVAPDGERFLVNLRQNQRFAPLTFAADWSADLE